MSHELRTPLNAIIGFSEVIQHEVRGPVPDVYRDYAKDIHSSGTHLLSLINDLLDLAKIEAGKLDLDESQIHLTRLADSCLRLIEPSAAKKNICVSFDSGAMPLIYADERALRQMLLNLLSNAVKFTGEGGRIRVGTSFDVKDGIHITVSDTGLGMRPEDIPRILEPFEQVSSAMTRTEQGTGLGLPLVKSLAELHGGTLEIASEPGIGTTVTIRLPADRALPGYLPTGFGGTA